MINDVLKSKGLDALIITSAENLRYFSAFTGGEGVLLITRGESVLFVDGRYTVQAKAQSTTDRVVEYKTSPFDEAQKGGLSKIGFEDAAVSYRLYERMRTAFSASEFVGVSDLILDYRAVKTAEELKSIKRAQAIADAAFLHILPFIKPGVTERQIAIELEYYMKKRGAAGTSFDTIVAAGERAALPHADVTDREVKAGEFVLMDYGCIYNGYCSDMTRTVAVGTPSEKMKKVYDTVLLAQKSAIYDIAPGKSCKEIDAIAREIIAKEGFEKNFNHSLGHGVGLQIHEQPNLSYRSDKVLRPGNVVTVEPGIYIEGEFGVRIEDLIFITDSGYENLTTSPKDLIIL